MPAFTNVLKFGRQLHPKALYAHIKETAIRNTAYAGDAITVAGLIGIVFYPIYYVIWGYWWPQQYESFEVRFIAMILCGIVVLHKKWPEKLKRYLPLYWHIAMIYCLPYFATYMMLKNDFSANWLSGQAIAFFLVVMLYIDWLIISLIYIAGTLLAWLVFSMEMNDASFLKEYIPYIPMFAFAICAGFICNYYVKRSIAINDRLHAVYSAATNVAHELRTPLGSIRNGIAGIERFVPTLLDGYKLAAEQQKVKPIDPLHMHCLTESFDSLSKSVEYSNQIISMLLINTDTKLINDADFTPCSISKCLSIALDNYPFKKQERHLLHWNKEHDFDFFGSEILMMQILHNLLRNSLYHIAKAGKGDIYIAVTQSKYKNQLHFRDTGTGIAKTQLKHIFKRFHTTRFEGNGIGLAFCKDVMQSFQGDIACQSMEGKFTEFTLSFPALAAKDDYSTQDHHALRNSKHHGERKLTNSAAMMSKV